MRLPVLVLVVLVLGVSIARADRAEGDALMAEGRYRDAADAYVAAYQDSGDAELLRDMGAAQQAAGDCWTATIYLRRYLAEVQPAPAVQASVEDRIALCERTPSAQELSPPSAASIVRPEAAAQPPKELRSYRGTMVGFDLALLVTVIPMANVSETLPAVWAVAWVIGPAIIHALNHNSYQSGVSLLRRLLLPVGGALVGGLLGAASCKDECWDILIGGVLGAGVGMVTAMFADWAYARVAVEAPRVVPTVDVTEDRMSFGLAATF